MFGPSLAPEDSAAGHEHRWSAPAVWQGVTADCAQARGVRAGMPWQRTPGVTLLTLIAPHYPKMGRPGRQPYALATM